MGTPVVIDTNVLVSGLKWSGTPAKIIRLVLEGLLTPVTCHEQLEELRRVLAYGRLHITEEEQTEYRQIMEATATVIPVTRQVTVVKEDPSDNIILELAIIGNAACIISGDRHLLKQVSFGGVPILTPAQFIAGWEAGTFLKTK